MTSHDKDKKVAGDLDLHVKVMTRILAAQIDGYQRLLASIRQKKQAIRDADIDSITMLCQQENAIAQKLSEAEKQRLALVGRITELLEPNAAKPLALREIAEAVGEPRQKELQDLAEAIREAIGNVRRESSIVTAAAKSLSRHMTGVMQSVNSALSRVGLYERRGRISVGAQMDFCIDVKS